MSVLRLRREATITFGHWPRRFALLGSLFLAGWGVLHLFIPLLAQYDVQLQGVPAFTVDYILLVNFFASVCLVLFGGLGVLVATRLWEDATAVKLVLWPLVGVALLYAAYMLVRPLRLPVPDPWLGVAHVAYVVLPVLLAFGFLTAALAAPPARR